MKKYSTQPTSLSVGPTSHFLFSSAFKSFSPLADSLTLAASSSPSLPVTEEAPMSCNGCRVLRKACTDHCILRTCLKGIPNAEAQGNATLFLAKFFGRSDLLALIAAVPESQRDAMFRSLLFEACGRTVNPVDGAVGLLSTGNWHVCQNAVSTVLGGGTLQPLPGNEPISALNTGRAQTVSLRRQFYEQSNDRVAANSPSSFLSVRRSMEKRPLKTASSTCTEMSEMGTVESSDGDLGGGGSQEIKLLNLFV